jgi:hypothetical protein
VGNGKIVNAVPKPPRDLRKERYEKTLFKIKELESKVKRYQNLLKRWKKKQKYYEKKLGI